MKGHAFMEGSPSSGHLSLTRASVKFGRSGFPGDSFSVQVPMGEETMTV